MSLLTGCAALRRLDVESCAVTDAAFAAVYEQRLRHDELGAAAGAMAPLEELGVSRCPGVTGLGLRHAVLATAGRGLRSVLFRHNGALQVPRSPGGDMRTRLGACARLHARARSRSRCALLRTWCQIGVTPGRGGRLWGPRWSNPRWGNKME